ncbi:MAG: epoxyqueuosine reductase QueH [Patescibacteria group bacterium]
MILRFTKILIALAWFLLVLRLVTMPMPYYPEAIERITLADKLVHFILFGGLFYFLADAFLKKGFSGSLNRALVGSAESLAGWRWAVYPSLGFSVIFSFFTEYLQLYIPSRTSSLYDTVAGLVGIAFFTLAFWKVKQPKKPTLLLHVCCIGCGAYVSRTLKNEFKVSLLYYNPNIFPAEEYKKRLEETKRIAKKFRLPLLTEEYDHKKWLKKVKGLEKEPEKGKRCLVCYEDRLTAAARLAKEKKLEYFTSTLTVSPYKDAKAINEIGKKLEKKYKVKFYQADFKKNDGFKKSCALSRELNLYRQDYCGCDFSRRNFTGKVQASSGRLPDKTSEKADRFTKPLKNKE